MPLMSKSTCLRVCFLVLRFTYPHMHSLPLIVTTFNAPAELCEAVRREVGRWGRRGLGYFSSDSHREEEMEELRAAMRDLQLKR